MESTRTRPAWGAAALVVLMVAALLVSMGMSAATADAKGGKVKTCAAKKGPDKGLLRLSKKGKCKKGEKKVVFAKKGPKGEQGPVGPAGAAGANGANNDELVTTVDTLENQLAQLTGRLDLIAPQVTALCAQVTDVTGQTDLIGGVLLAVNQILDPLTLLDLPTVPGVLGNFDCP